MECMIEHNNHNGIYYGDIISNIGNIDKNEYKLNIDKIIDNINEIIKKLEEIK